MACKKSQKSLGRGDVGKMKMGLLLLTGSLTFQGPFLNHQLLPKKRQTDRTRFMSEIFQGR